jgi:hypothetical protein
MEQAANKIDADCLACDFVAFFRLPKPKKVNCETTDAVATHIIYNTI